MLDIETIINLRGHHLLCLCNFVGYGYNLNFVNNMTKISKFLKSNLNLRCIKIVEGLDDLCCFCPNKTKNADKFYLMFEGCRFDDVLARDRDVLNLFNFRVGSLISFGEVLTNQKILVSNEIFLKICKNCRWFSLCSSVRNEKL